MNSKKRIVWISILQGLAMLLVVIGHVDLNGQEQDASFPIAGCLHRIIYSFHMPLFMFLSGYLFFLTKISKSLGCITVMKNKIIRLYIPFIFFTLMTYILKSVFSSYMKNPSSWDIDYFLSVFVYYKANPLGEMWFIVALLILMTLYPLYLYCSRSKYHEFSLLIIFFIINISNINCDYFFMSQVFYMGFFFYSGVLSCKYNLIDYLYKKRLFYLFLSFFIIVNPLLTKNLPNIIYNFSGILFSLSLSIFLSKIHPSIFQSFRDFTYQIFLLGIFFQMLVRYLYGFIGNESLYGLLFLVSILSGIYIPSIISSFSVKHKLKFICIILALPYKE